MDSKVLLKIVNLKHDLLWLLITSFSWPRYPPVSLLPCISWVSLLVESQRHCELLRRGIRMVALCILCLEIWSSGTI